MTLHIPDDPNLYFLDFFPEQFRANRHHYPSGDSAAATRFRIEGAGSWTLRVAGDELRVEASDAAEVALELACDLAAFQALFVAYPRAEVAQSRVLSDGTKAALRPLVLDSRKHAVCQRSRRTLALELLHDRMPQRLLVTPGGGRATASGSTVRLSFEDYLAIQTGKRNTKGLFLFRRLKVKGDLSHALKLEPLLG